MICDRWEIIFLSHRLAFDILREKVVAISLISGANLFFRKKEKKKKKKKKRKVNV